MRTNRTDVEMALSGLNRAADKMGLMRRFEVRYGSAANGIHHEMAEVHPGLAHPTTTKIGKTYGAAHRYLAAMRHALDSANADREYRRDDVLGNAPAMALPAFDPDARSVRRIGE